MPPTKKRSTSGATAPDAKRPKADEPPAPAVAFLSASLQDAGWLAALSSEASKPYLLQLHKFVQRERASKTIYPPANEMLAALQACPLSRIKVVIVGQDPYHGAGQAHGLAFSVRRGFEGKFPPSLRNIINECVADLGPSKQFSKPRDKRLGDLSPWAKQGVLLLNTCLTVRKGEANSHAGRGYEQLTDAIIEAVNSRAVQHQPSELPPRTRAVAISHPFLWVAVSSQGPGCVFLLWGKPALAKCAGIDESKHRVICTSHPSPLSNWKTDSPFTGSRCFSRANAALLELGWQVGVNWKLN